MELMIRRPTTKRRMMLGRSKREDCEVWNWVYFADY